MSNWEKCQFLFLYFGSSGPPVQLLFLVQWKGCFLLFEDKNNTINRPHNDWLSPTKALRFCFFTVHSSFSASSHPSSITLPPLLALLTSPLTSPLHLHTSPPHWRTLSSPLTSPLPPPTTTTSFSSSPPLYLPIASLIPYLSLVNNSTAVHTWVVIVELHMGDLEDKWTIRMEELKTSPRLHYRAGGICRLPACLAKSRLCVFSLSSPHR